MCKVADLTSTVHEDFPPLGGQLKDSQPVDTFGFLKSQLPSDSAGRVGTPSLPPGLPLPQSHPASAVFQDQLSLSKPSSPAPSLPPGLNMNISRTGTPSQKNLPTESTAVTPELPSRKVTTSARVQDASQISLGSPVPKSAHKSRIMTKLDLFADDDKASPAKADQSPLIGTKASPITLSMHLAAQETASAKSERVLSGTSVSGPGPASAIGSRPNTPLTTVSRVSDSSVLRQPRILRVVDTPKTEVPPPITNAPSAPVSTVKSGKSQSRRQSFSSSSRPDTPGDFGSEADLFPSASVSRASSPPATSRIGSAPVRSITKSQLKKERRQKAKEAEAKQVETATPEEPVQAPILGRKRKTKKAPTATTSSVETAPTTMPEPTTPVKPPAPSPKKVDPKPEPPKKVKEKEQPIQETKPAPPPAPAPVVEQPAPPQAPPEPWRSHNTVEQLLKDAEESGRPIKDLFVERTKALHEVLAEMHKSGELDLHRSSLFNPANLGQRTDMKGIDSDYFLLKQPLELFESHRRALMRGQPVRIDAEQLSDRCLITPRGCVLRHLSAEEEDRYLELEKQRGGAMDPFMVGDDSSNINGGLDALFATPEKYNICWVDDNSSHLGSTSPTGTVNGADSVIPPNVLSAMEADSTRSHDWAVAHSAEILQTTTAAVRSFAAATAKQMLGSAGVPGTNPSLDDVAAMTNEELKEFAGHSQKDLESGRKELDVLDKKLAALLRRNKKIQQAALSLVEEA